MSYQEPEDATRATVEPETEDTRCAICKRRVPTDAGYRLCVGCEREMAQMERESRMDRR